VLDVKGRVYGIFAYVHERGGERGGGAEPMQEIGTRENPGKNA